MIRNIFLVFILLFGCCANSYPRQQDIIYKSRETQMLSSYIMLSRLKRSPSAQNQFNPQFNAQQQNNKVISVQLPEVPHPYSGYEDGSFGTLNSPETKVISTFGTRKPVDNQDKAKNQFNPQFNAQQQNNTVISAQLYPELPHEYQEHCHGSGCVSPSRPLTEFNPQFYGHQQFNNKHIVINPSNLKPQSQTPTYILTSSNSDYITNRTKVRNVGETAKAPSIGIFIFIHLSVFYIVRNLCILKSEGLK